jgi:hypothetical protein
MAQIIGVERVIRCPRDDEVMDVDTCESCELNDPDYSERDEIRCLWDGGLP